MLGDIPLKNRFFVLGESNMAETSEKQSGGGMNRQVFQASNHEEKLLAIFDELRFMRDEQVATRRDMSVLTNSTLTMSEKLVQVAEVTNQQTEFMKQMAYKSIDVEARSRRNNLIFRGLAENFNENCTILIHDFLEDRFDLAPRDVYIARAHRLGPHSFGRRYNRRPIIVNFRDYQIVEQIMNKVSSALRNTPFSIDYDFPKEISDARKKLWPKYKEIKANDRNAKPKIVYPAKLIVNGHVLQDEFPDWREVMSKSRVSHIQRVNVHPNTHRLARVMQNDTQVQMDTSSHTIRPANLGQGQGQSFHEPSYTAETITDLTQAPTEIHVQSDVSENVLTLLESSQASSADVTPSPTFNEESPAHTDMSLDNSTQSQSLIDPVVPQASTAHSVYTEPNVSFGNSSVFKSMAPANIPTQNANTPSLDSNVSDRGDKRGRSVSHVSRAAKRDERRSSNSPYRRSVSHSRAAKNRTADFPASINSTRAGDASENSTHA